MSKRLNRVSGLNSVFLKSVGILLAFAYCSYACSSNVKINREIFYGAVVTGDAPVVKNLLKIDASLATAYYAGKPMLWHLLRETRLKKKVGDLELKDYARIIALMGKNAAELQVSKVVGRDESLLSYSLRRCYPQMDKALIKFEPKPEGYTPKNKKKGGLNKVTESVVQELSSFFIKQINAVDYYFSNKGDKKPADVVFPELNSGGNSVVTVLKDIEGRTLSGRLEIELRSNSAVDEFYFKLFSQNQELSDIRFIIQRLSFGVDVFVEHLETVEGERQNGFGGMLLDALIKACSTLGKRVSISLYAYPIGCKNDVLAKMFLPILIHFYKQHFFMPGKYSASNLRLTIVDGKVLSGYEVELLKKK